MGADPVEMYAAQRERYNRRVSFEIAFLFGVLLVMAVLFLTERLPIELTAFLGLATLVLGGLVEPEQAFVGFASPAVITMFSIFFISAALLQTGVADLVAGRMQRVFGNGEVALMVATMILAGALSAFMNNVAATAVMLPAVAALARRAGLSPGRLLMPLAFGAILGGTTTLVGTPPNLLTTEVLTQAGLEPFALFEFAPVGLTLLALGCAFMATFGRRLLPARAAGGAYSPGRELPRVYRLDERLFAIRIPQGASLDGRTLKEAHLGTRLGVNVVAIVRDGVKQLSPEPDQRLQAGDMLLVGGRMKHIRELARVQALEFEGAADELRDTWSRLGMLEAVVRVPAGSLLAGKDLAQLEFRARFGLVVGALWREGKARRGGLARMALREGDELLLIGPQAAVEALSKGDDFDLLELGPPALQRIEPGLFLVSIPRESALAGRTLGESRMGELVGLDVVGHVRQGEVTADVTPGTELAPGDQLLVTGDPQRILGLLDVGRIELEEATPDLELESETVGVAEAVIAPRARIAGRTPAELEFRTRYGLTLLAIWRGDRPLRTGLAQRKLAFGDALLLHGPRERLRLLCDDPDFLMLTDLPRAARRPRKAPVAIGGLLLMIAFVVTGFQPIQVAAFTAAALVVLGGALTMDEAYRAVEWRAMFLVAAILPVGAAMERTGAALMLSQAVNELAGPLGPYAVLTAMVVLSSLFSQCLDGAPTVVLLGPVALHAARELGISPYPLVMGVGLAASAAFMTPFSHKANLLVMGAGGYRVKDYLRVGAPLNLVVLAALVLWVPVLLPF